MFSFQNITLLFVESDKSLRKSITALADDNGIHVLATDNIIRAFDLFKTNKVDILVINIEPNNGSSLDFIKHLREKEILTPVIITSDSDSKELLLTLINLDITKYLIKPYTNKEMLDALKMAQKKLHYKQLLGIYELDNGYSYDIVNKSIHKPDESVIFLTKKESQLIEFLLHNKNQIIPYEVIENSIWEDASMSLDALRTLVHGIRKKSYPDIIKNHNGIGYKMDLYDSNNINSS